MTLPESGWVTLKVSDELSLSVADRVMLTEPPEVTVTPVTSFATGAPAGGVIVRVPVCVPL